MIIVECYADLDILSGLRLFLLYSSVHFLIVKKTHYLLTCDVPALHLSVLRYGCGNGDKEKKSKSWYHRNGMTTSKSGGHFEQKLFQVQPSPVGHLSDALLNMKIHSPQKCLPKQWLVQNKSSSCVSSFARLLLSFLLLRGCIFFDSFPSKTISIEFKCRGVQKRIRPYYGIVCSVAFIQLYIALYSSMTF